MQQDKTNNDVAYKRERIVRVIVQFRNGTTSVGTGFFISNQGDILTCFHVISGTELRNLNVTNQSGLSIKNTESGNTALKDFLANVILSIEIQLTDGTRKLMALQKFDEGLDVALLRINESDEKTGGANGGANGQSEVPHFELDTTSSLEYDQSTFFCGFQMTGGIANPMDYPFTTNRAVISGFPNVEVAGNMHEHVQLNSINLDGNSGAPLFAEGSNFVIGIINGNMNWRVNNIEGIVSPGAMPNTSPNFSPNALPNSQLNALQNNSQDTPPATAPIFIRNSNLVPLCIAFATSVKLIKEKTEII